LHLWVCQAPDPEVQNAPHKYTPRNNPNWITFFKGQFMYIYTQSRATRDPPPPGAQLFTSVTVFTTTG